MVTPAPALDLVELGPEFLRDPYPSYAKLREQGPVHRVRTPDGDVWLVVGHDACRAAYTDPRLSRDLRNGPPMIRAGHQVDPASPVQAHMLQRDPPDHTRLRRLVARSFTPRRIGGLAPRVQQLTDELLDGMLARAEGRADLVEALAFPLPMTVICELLGVPGLDRDVFREWSNEIVAPTTAQAQEAAQRDIVPYLTELIAAKRRAPGEDLLSEMIHSVDDGGDRLSGDELIGMCVLLLVAGHETTVNLIGNGLRALFAHPDQLALLRGDPSLLEGAVEEMLRWDGPVETSLPRLALEDVALDVPGGGRTVIPAGSSVLIAMADADRDPERFREPNRFDIRRDARGHIAFGHGLHFCLGAPLARLEGRIAIGTLLERCPQLAFDGDESTLPRIPGLLIRGVQQLPVRW